MPGNPERSHLYRIFPHSTNVLSHIDGYPKKLKKEHDPLIVGVELEVSTDYDIQKLIDAQEDLFFLGKQDGSLSGSKPYLIELVTCPASIKYLKRHFALLFEKLDYSGFDTSLKTNNGMHVHVSREHFEDQSHERNFIWFYNNPANIKFHFLISERNTMNEIQNWCPPHYYGSGQSKVKAFQHTVDHTHYNRGITHQKGGKRGSTIEVRLFKGIVSYATIVKNLEYVDATFEFTRQAPLYSELSIPKFLAWLKKTPANKYICLKEFIDNEIDLDKIKVEMEIKEVIFNEQNPTKILKMVEKANLNITDEHIKFLNKIDKKAFFYNKKTGKLELIPEKGGKLATKDKPLSLKILGRRHDGEQN